MRVMLLALAAIWLLAGCQPRQSEITSSHAYVIRDGRAQALRARVADAPASILSIETADRSAIFSVLGDEAKSMTFKRDPRSDELLTVGMFGLVPDQEAWAISRTEGAESNALFEFNQEVVELADLGTVDGWPASLQLAKLEEFGMTITVESSEQSLDVFLDDRKWEMHTVLCAGTTLDQWSSRGGALKTGRRLLCSAVLDRSKYDGLTYFNCHIDLSDHARGIVRINLDLGE